MVERQHFFWIDLTCREVVESFLFLEKEMRGGDVPSGVPKIYKHKLRV